MPMNIKTSNPQPTFNIFKPHCLTLAVKTMRMPEHKRAWPALGGTQLTRAGSQVEVDLAAAVHGTK